MPTSGGNVTDNVFLLSSLEVNTYFSSDKDRISLDGNSWFLRTVNSVVLPVLNYSELIAMEVTPSGEVFQEDSTSNYSHGIRPAIWGDFSDYV